VSLLTIGIPTFNRVGEVTALLDCLAREIEAAEANDITVLVSDNASDDATPAVLAELAAAHPWLRVHRQPENLGAARNVSWLVGNASDAEYLWMIGDDDVISPGGLATVLDTLRAERPAWLFLPHHWIGLEGEHIPGPPAPEVPERHATAGDLYRAWHHWLTFFSASVVRADALRDAVAASDTQNAYAPLLWYFAAGFDGPCVVAPGHIVHGSLAISWMDRRHIYVTEHFTSLYDEGIHRGVTRAEFAATLDHLYADPSMYEHWSRVPIDKFAAIVAKFPECGPLRRYLFQAAREQQRSDVMPVLETAAHAAGVADAAHALVAEGEERFGHADFLSAAHRFQEATQLMPALTVAWNDLAVVLHEIGRLREAAEAVECALFVAPDDEDANANREIIAAAARV
jgi:glycosyltransferase involved in cell wall biosynthesis